MDPFENPDASIEDCLAWLQEELIYEAENEED